MNRARPLVQGGDDSARFSGAGEIDYGFCSAALVVAASVDLSVDGAAYALTAGHCIVRDVNNVVRTPISAKGLFIRFRGFSDAPKDAPNVALKQVVFATAEGEQACMTSQPCEADGAAIDYERGTSYAISVSGLNGCFDSAGRFALDRAGCPLDRDIQMLPDPDHSFEQKATPGHEVVLEIPLGRRRRAAQHRATKVTADGRLPVFVLCLLGVACLTGHARIAGYAGAVRSPLRQEELSPLAGA